MKSAIAKAPGRKTQGVLEYKQGSSKHRAKAKAKEDTELKLKLKVKEKPREFLKNKN